jgi:UDP-N-acetylmuramoyl-tripeptide--D-alanyl-D-alanine ligase
MNKFKSFFSLYRIGQIKTNVYMLQQVEYRPNKFLDWFIRVLKSNQSFKNIQKRSELKITVKARLLVLFQYFIIILVLVAISLFFSYSNNVYLVAFLLLLVILPFILVLSLYVLSLIAYDLIIKPKIKNIKRDASLIFENNRAIKIAVLGSYGKTTIKEALKTILAEKFVVSVTPGNKNVISSHNEFAKSLKGDEDVIILEFGEGRPGDIGEMASMFKPQYAVVTGIAPNHLDEYESIEDIANDFISICDFVNKNNLFFNANSELLSKYFIDKAQKITNKSIAGWKIENVLVSVTQTSFSLKNGRKTININTGLLGRHHVPIIAYCAVLAHDLGLNVKQIEDGCMKIRPYDHRMQSRKLHGAWLIDDTYNGNIEGLRAGLELLNELDMKRKWYVTPGLVDQGSETVNVHKELGKLIALANPDIVVLMKNSVTELIEESLLKSDYKGELRIEDSPLEFYTNLEHHVVAGDLVLMQNDWTDNYN